jgi:hypothetical protein
MARHKHVINLCEVAVDRINAPEDSPFGGLRQRVGAHIGAQKTWLQLLQRSSRQGGVSVPYAQRQ